MGMINRDTTSRHNELISRSLKSHDSKTLMPQTTSSQNNQGSLKGKMLDFENVTSELLESGIILTKNKQSSDENILDEDSDLQKANDQLVSYLEGDDMMSHIRARDNEKR